jgi:hypothetical protein
VGEETVVGRCRTQMRMKQIDLLAPCKGAEGVRLIRPVHVPEGCGVPIRAMLGSLVVFLYLAQPFLDERTHGQFSLSGLKRE